MTIREEVYRAALAGLLHDVGKFAQRAGEQPDADYQAFSQEDYGAHGAHAKWSATFVSRHVPEDWRKGLAPVLYHHKPQDRLSKVVALADRLSAAEREGSGEGAERQLLSIFCRLGAADKRPADQFWPLRPLALDKEALFPGAPLSSAEETTAYKNLWKGFITDVEELPRDDQEAFLEGLFYALQKYTWCIPGAYYRSLPDVSLFDHSRTTAALAACLAGLDEPALDELLLPGKASDRPLALLLGGDMSGVQAFIYTITARGAAKGLRGRSFYLQLLTEAAARYVLRRLELPITNLLYVGGGHFYLLAPYVEEAVLRDIQAEVSRKLLDHHQGDLYLALGWSEAKAADFQRERFGEKWREVSQAMNAAKRRRFAEMDAETLRERVFVPYGEGGDEKGECQVCHYDGPGIRAERQGTPEERRICELCQSLEELGTQLRDADFVLLAQVPPQDGPRAGFTQALASLGLAVGLTAQDGRSVRRVTGGTERATLLAMRDMTGVAEQAARVAQALGCPVAAGTRYTVNVTPRKPDGEIATFDWLQQQSLGVERLGVLRMDVDDLGDLFRWGMDNATLSRVASFSFALSLFFEGWVGELCRQANEAAENDKVYAIYSGGDDLFIVGAWDVLPDLAHTISQDLLRFAAGNRDVHLSGGLTLHAGKYPLYQAARDAEDALDAAKDLERPEVDHKKDAFNFLGLTIPWERYAEMVGLKDELVNLTAPKEQGGASVSRAILHTLGRLYAHYQEQAQAKTYWGPWMWRGAYNLTRQANQYKRVPETKARIEKVRDDLKRDDYGYLELVGPAARWAELETRKEQER